ncbi:MAG: rhodanese-like domain-containing protein [Planctomycetota bacterium]|nr:rhodanese-like domain-containing protein [Planctomycetota bacterium]
MRHRVAILVVSWACFATAIVAVPGCGNNISDKNLKYIPLIEVDQLLHPRGSLFHAAVPGVWVDPRLTKSYVEGHIPGAISIPFPEMLTVADQELGGGKYGAIIIYDTNYDDILGKSGAKRLMEMGFKEVYNLQGGLEAWKQAGHPLVTGPNPN